MRNRNNHSQRGIALLFALGLLTLLMVLALAFAANALIYQKTAVANANYSQMKVLADSAVNLLRVRLQHYQDSAAHGTAHPVTFAGEVSQNGAAKDKTRSTTAAPTYRDDQLNVASGAQPPLLEYSFPKDTDNKLYNPTLSTLPGFMKSDWVYQKNSDGYLTSRYAFAVLPDLPLQSLRTASSAATGRAGKSATEVVRQMPTGLNVAFDGYANYRNYAQVFNKNSADAAGQVLIRRNFELFNPADIEAYYFDANGNGQPDYNSNAEWFHRFQLNRSAANWGTLSVHDLLGLSGDGTTTEAAKVDAAKLFDVYRQPQGTGSNLIQFLRMVGADAGGADTLLNRRKQVAANLLTFFRRTGKSASDKETSGTPSWTPSVLPSCTGLVPQPSINEVVVTINVSANVSEISHWFYNYNTSATILSLSCAVELANPFGNSGNYRADVSGIRIMGKVLVNNSVWGDSGGANINAASCVGASGGIGVDVSSNDYAHSSVALAQANVSVGDKNSATLGTNKVVLKSETVTIDSVILYDSSGTPVDCVRNLTANISDTTILTISAVGSALGSLRVGFQVKDPLCNLYGNSSNWEIRTATGVTSPVFDVGRNTLNSGAQEVEIDSIRKYRIKKWFENDTSIEPSFAMLNLIHRGAPGEWLDITRTGTFSAPAKYDPNCDITAAGASVSDGDGGILDQLKMVPDKTERGKVNLNFRKVNYTRYGATVEDWATASGKLLYTGLFDSVPLNNALGTAAGETLAAPYATAATLGEAIFTSPLTFANRAAVINPLRETLESAGLTSLQINEFIGRVLPLCKAGELPTVIRAVVVAQGLRENLLDKLKINRGGENLTLRKGVMDIQNGVYGDDIIGQARMVVTIARNPATGKFYVVEKEYLDE